MKKKYLLLFIAPLLLSLITAEVLVFLNKGKHRHIIDYKVNYIVPQSTHKNHDNILLGDSLLDNAIGNIKLKENVLDLSTSAYITLPGNLFLLKRLLDNKKEFKPKNVYLFLSTPIFNKISKGNKELYYKTVFNNKEEISTIKKIEKDTMPYNIFIRYFLSRKRAFVKEYYTIKTRKNEKGINSTLLEKISPKKNFNNKKVTNNILKAKYTMNNLDTEEKYAIKEISKLVKSKKMNLYFVLEPVPQEINNYFKESKLKKYLISNGYTVLNINDYYKFDNYFFKDDGIHIKGNVNKYYTYLIDKYIVDIL